MKKIRTLLSSDKESILFIFDKLYLNHGKHYDVTDSLCKLIQKEANRFVNAIHHKTISLSKRMKESSYFFFLLHF